MRYRGAHHLPEWLERGASILLDNRTEDIAPVIQRIEKPICIEVGCGKGGFIRKMAKQFPDFHFIGLDRVITVLAKGAAEAMEDEPTNLLYIYGDIEYVAAKIEPHSIERLFLNFSDPWPKNRHEDRRLTAHNKLSLYENLLIRDGVIEQKTDNRDFFEWSVNSFETAGWRLEEVNRDFAEGEPTNLSSKYIQTEYEQKFRGQGVPIHYLRALKSEL